MSSWMTARFIPTGVGNTLTNARSRLTTSVHPHGRGEHGAGLAARAQRRGSSPRAWGTPPMWADLAQAKRFIPTGVGNTEHKESDFFIRPVHPHGRGEHVLCGRYRVTEYGSSPRAWGTRPSRRYPANPGRFIPTGVGNTGKLAELLEELTVHPHGRGEHVSSYHYGRSCAGSSPRAWGTPKLRLYYLRFWRFIPTGVGNTCLGLLAISI